MYQWVFTRKAISVLIVTLVTSVFALGCLTDLIAWATLGHVGQLKR